MSNADNGSSNINQFSYREQMNGKGHYKWMVKSFV